MRAPSINIRRAMSFAASLVLNMGVIGCAHSVQLPKSPIDYGSIIKQRTYGKYVKRDMDLCYRPMPEKPFLGFRKKVLSEISKRQPDFDAYILIEAGEKSFDAYYLYFSGVTGNNIYWGTASDTNLKFKLHQTAIKPKDQAFVSLLESKLTKPLVTPPPSSDRGIVTNTRCSFVTIDNNYGSYFFIDTQNEAWWRLAYPELVTKEDPPLLPGEKVMFKFYQLLHARGVTTGAL